MAMACPDCSAPGASVVDSRNAGPQVVRRRRRCANGHRFTTYEVPQTYLLRELLVSVRTRWTATGLHLQAAVGRHWRAMAPVLGDDATEPEESST